jgi:peroxiredoxin
VVFGFEHDRTPHRASSADNVTLLTISAKALQNDFATMKNIAKIRVLSPFYTPQMIGYMSNYGLVME